MHVVLEHAGASTAGRARSVAAEMAALFYFRNPRNQGAAMSEVTGQKPCSMASVL